MPKYVYFCKDCKKEFEIIHSLSKKWEICNFCGIDAMLVRKPSSIFISKKIDKIASKSKAGDVVKATIEESKKELHLEKERLKNREYGDD